jgi:hypothetical protein
MGLFGPYVGYGEKVLQSRLPDHLRRAEGQQAPPALEGQPGRHPEQPQTDVRISGHFFVRLRV